MDRLQYHQIKQFLQNETMPAYRETKMQQRQWKNICKKFQLIEGQLFKLNKWKKATKVLQQGKTEPIIYLYHNDPIARHFGANKTLGKLKLQYHWLKIYEEIKKYMKSCHICQTQGRQKKNN